MSSGSREGRIRSCLSMEGGKLAKRHNLGSVLLQVHGQMVTCEPNEEVTLTPPQSGGHTYAVTRLSPLSAMALDSTSFSCSGTTSGQLDGAPGDDRSTLITLKGSTLLNTSRTLA